MYEIPYAPHELLVHAREQEATISLFPKISTRSTLVQSIRDWDKQFDLLVTTVINKNKLKRNGWIPSFLQTKGSIGTEPNIGPFPQFNFVIEDEPIEDVADHLRRKRRHYKSRIHDELVSRLDKATQDLTRLETVLHNPRTLQAGSASYKLLKMMVNKPNPESLLQDYEQFVEANAPPYQEIHIHPESLAPEGGDAPILPRDPYRFMNLNSTTDTLALTLMSAEEKTLLTQLETIAKGITSAK